MMFGIVLQQFLLAKRSITFRSDKEVAEMVAKGKKICGTLQVLVNSIAGLE
jgi:hypothetical protein